jgi:calcineurin-like phosphoesterase family protein
MGKIWLCSDLHFGHNQPFIYEPRGFKTIEEHDRTIIQNWNELVSWDDEVWLLGDVMLNDNEGGIRKLNQLAGKIYILAGNHDSTNRIQMYANIRPTILTMGLAYILKYQGYNFYLSHYPTICSNYNSDRPLKQQMINLCGHYHTQDRFKDMDKGIIYHVELDAHNNKPILLDNIIEDIKKYKGVK